MRLAGSLRPHKLHEGGICLAPVQKLSPKLGLEFSCLLRNLLLDLSQLLVQEGRLGLGSTLQTGPALALNS